MASLEMQPEQTSSSSYLKLTQFLDLESRWLGAPNRAELCHRICKTVVILLDIPAVAIGVGERGGRYAVLASEGDWSEARGGDSATSDLLAKARGGGTPQLKSKGDVSIGVFPFALDGGASGCLHVKIDRPVFQGAEVTFLRFIASLAGIMLAGGMPAPSAPAAAGDEQPSERAARRYVAMAVHDLRNPLNVVSGYASLLADESLGGLTDDQREAVSAIGRQVGVLLSVVDQLIDLDQIIRCETKLAPSSFDVRELFDELRETCFPHEDGRIMWPGPEAGFEFKTDRRRVFSIAQNLVDNAVKHSGTGQISVECTREQKQLVITVSDSGPGLDPQLRASLVGHASNGAAAAPRGGLGLFSVASYVRALDAKIAVTDRPGGGTTIEVRIPPSA